MSDSCARLIPAATTRRTKIRVVMCGWLLVQALPQLAYAQKPGNVPEEDGGWLRWVMIAGFGVIVCVTAFLNPKRTHLD